MAAVHSVDPIPPMYTDDSQIYIILNPEDRREELLCWVVD